MSGSIDPRTGLEELGYDDGLRVVGASTMGRLAVVAGGQPLVFPVNITLVRQPAEVAQLERLPPGPWCPGPKPVWLRIRHRTITGRRIPAHGMHRVEQREGLER